VSRIGDQNVRLDGILIVFPSQTAALEPLLRLTLTMQFYGRQEVNLKKTE